MRALGEGGNEGSSGKGESGHSRGNEDTEGGKGDEGTAHMTLVKVFFFRKKSVHSEDRTSPSPPLRVEVLTTRSTWTASIMISYVYLYVIHVNRYVKCRKERKILTHPGLNLRLPDL